jgi:hypothetical protein
MSNELLVLIDTIFPKHQRCLMVKAMKRLLILMYYIHNSPRWCLHLVVEVGLASSNDLKSYAGGSVATDRVSQTGKVKSEDPD